MCHPLVAVNLNLNKSAHETSIVKIKIITSNAIAKIICNEIRLVDDFCVLQQQALNSSTTTQES